MHEIMPAVSLGGGNYLKCRNVVHNCRFWTTAWNKLSSVQT